MAVSRLNNAMLVVEAVTKQLAAILQTISRLIGNISGKVSALDVAKTRVVECLQLAGDMHDLGVCSEEVDRSINNEDHEQAAQHIHPFLTLDRTVFQFSCAPDKGRLHFIIFRIKFLSSLSQAVTANNEHDSGLVLIGKYLSRQIAKIGEDNLKEPSQLFILQSSHVPYIILQSMLGKEVPNSRDVISHMENVFTALCLNEKGLKQFEAYAPFDHVFNVVLSIKFVVTMKKKRSKMSECNDNLDPASI
ncbi:unnamed protein product [Cylicostephanus goldi]|uniref:Uncharacterized protein n=1 Tax=Cylicostephanus goldi TaxID=71465 RepID=A0A3P7MTF0_CYLGO|nr:unnamed protein product [Cylicostephanus goldi]